MFANTGKIVVIVGPTCTGKSELSLELARRFNGEIVNADSMQVYKYFNIGTAKPEPGMMAHIPHHLIDVAEPNDDFNAAIFQDLASSAIRGIWGRRHIPIVVGGTGLYIRALMYGLFKVEGDTALRAELSLLYDHDAIKFYEDLKKIDSQYVSKISFRDKRRMVRAMEVFRLTGFTMSEWSKKHGFKKARYEALKIGLRKPRDLLFNRINLRVEDMLARGWVDEVRKMLAQGIDERLKPFTSIGYREILKYLNGILDYDTMVNDIKKFTRHYAKRQFTWFLKEKDIEWHEYPEERDDIVKKVGDFLK